MKTQPFGRLVTIYRSRLMRLFRNSIVEMIEQPEITSTPEFRAMALEIAQEMAREVANVNAKSWRTAAMRTTNAKAIYRALQNEIELVGIGPVLREIARQNAELISSLPIYVARKVSAHATEMVQQGKRPEEIARELKVLAPHLTKSRIELISRTEVSRAETQLTQARAQRIGIEWGQWVTSKDQRVRASHKNLDQVIMRFSDPPQPEALVGEKSTLGRGLAGEFPNCRCVFLPLISLDEVRFPVRVYQNGSISRYTRSQFSKLIERPMAA